MRCLLPLVVLAAACKPPPPAPEGLDDSTAYLVRNFWADDATFGAGVVGFMEWFQDEGLDLLGQGATLETTDAFTVGDLVAEDVEHLPLSEDILIDPGNDERIPRDVSSAKGIVSLAEMDCSWLRAEQLLVRPDQDTVFPRDWEGYERTYRTDPDTFRAGATEESFTPIRESLDPFADDFDPETYNDTLLFTDNMVDPTAVLVANVPSYPMELDMRHGIFDIDGEPTGMFAILTFAREAAWGSAGANGLLQSFSIEINVERPEDRTLRMLAVWTEPKGGGIQADDPVALNFAVTKSLNSSNTLSEICSGELEID